MPVLPPGEDPAPVDYEVPEDAMERLAHLEALVVQLKELIRDRDTQLTQKDVELTSKDAQLKVNKPFLFVSNQCVPVKTQLEFVWLCVRRMKEKKLRPASLSSNSRLKPRWLHSTNR